MKRFVAAVALSLMLLLPGHADQAKPEKNKKTARALTLLAEDKGTFRILVNGQPAGTEEFQIAPAGGGTKEWTARGSTQIRVPGGASGEPNQTTAQVRARLVLAPDGVPLRYEWSTQGSKKASAVVEFQGGTAKMSLQLEGAQPFVQELSFGSPRVLILDNNLYHHYAILARLYDWNAKDAQTFPVLIPQDLTPGTVTVEALGPVPSPAPEPALSGAEGLEQLRVRTSDLDVNLYLDSGRRLVRLAVPSAKATVLRE